MSKYKCPTLGDCDKANAGEVFERAAGDELKCPNCGTLLVPVAQPGATDATRNKLPMIIGGIVVLVGLAGGGYVFSSKNTKVPEVAQVSQETAVPVLAAPANTNTANSGIPPSEADTKALRQDSQNKLTSGDAASAEQASSKAAANEMLKLSIAKMAQGKFDEADQVLSEARIKDPKQSLVYYNTAILRLKQARVEDALKEFEASFMAGFKYFEKMDQDPDLDVLRKDPRFIKLVSQYRS